MSKKAYKRERGSVVELRSFPLTMERAGTGTASGTLAGYAAVFNRETVLVPKDAWCTGSPEVREFIAPGAFKRTIKNSDQRAVWNHNTDFVLGRRKNGTLNLSEDEKGLRTEITPPDTDLVRDMVIAPIDRGDVDQMSFAFRVIDDKITETRDLILIELREVDLIEVSPVAIPAYTDTEIALSARSADRIEELRSKWADSPERNGHAGTPAPVETLHLDADLVLEWERLSEEIAA